ncbi:MAG: glycosyltransferase family 39 protein [Acidobacteria bacterium]|nr:glycosyltransferase family 39 protein [Acidobacteriota bacterium]
MKRRQKVSKPTPNTKPSAILPDSAFLWPALAVFVVALTIRLVHLWQMSGTPYFSVLMGDARGYDTWARTIAAGDWIGREVFYQAPLYPYFLGVVYTIFGSEVGAARLAQVVVGSFSCVLLAYAGRWWFSPRLGLAAGMALALYAPAIFFDGIIQKSVLDVFFVCVALALLGFLARAGEAGGGGRGGAAGWSTLAWVALGIAIGCLSLTRENALVVVGVVGAWAFVGHEPPGLSAPTAAPAAGPLRRSRRRWRAVALFLLGVSVTLVPVAVRNYAVGGGFYLTTSQFGPNFYIGNNPQADGTYMSLRFGRGSPEFERVDATEIAERALERPLTPGEVSSYWTNRAWRFITTEPGRWLWLTARKAALLVNATEMIDTESQEAHAEYSWPVRLLQPLAHFGVLVPLAVFGVWITWRDRGRLWILYALGLTYAVSTVIFFVFARYRYPLAPVLLLFATAGVAKLASAWRVSKGGTHASKDGREGHEVNRRHSFLQDLRVFVATVVGNGTRRGKWIGPSRSTSKGCVCVKSIQTCASIWLTRSSR